VLAAKLTKQDQDEFDVWSKERAQMLARANEKLASRAFNSYLGGLNFWDLAFSARNPWGLWTFSAVSRCFTFVPFRYGWASPYGHYYDSYYRLYSYLPGGGYCGGGIVRGPAAITNLPPNGLSGGSLGSAGSSSGSSGSSPRAGAPRSPATNPPAAPMRDPDSGRILRKIDP